MSLGQALKLARAELAVTPWPQRATRLTQIARLFCSEVAGTIALAPYALRASQLHAAAERDGWLVPGIAYCDAPRGQLDLYRPPSDAGHTGGAAPVVVFVHGGVWAAGERWHYAPLAASLARLGVVTAVVSYSLFPPALVPAMVEEVSAAFEWALQNAASHGGDPRRVTLVGHSAGAQLCMMALLQRAQAAHAAATAAGPAHSRSSNGGGTQQQQQQQPAMPHRFIGITGVYDIARHYAYEQQRGVASLSTLLPAMDGQHNFAAQSPSVILAAALQQHAGGGAPLPQGGLAGGGDLPACGFYNSFPLAGEAIAHRIGFDRGSSHDAAAEAGLLLQSLAGMKGVPEFALAAAAHLPPTVLLSSCTDVTVPWFESAELYWRLFDAGVPVKHLVYNKVGHGDFVVDWPNSFTDEQEQDDDSSSGSGSGDARAALLQQLPPHCRDVAAIVAEQQPVSFVRKPCAAASPAAAADAFAALAAPAAADERGLAVQPAELN